MKEWTMDLLQMTIYALSGKKIISQLVKLVAIFYAQVHVNVKENDFCAVLTRKQQKSNEMIVYVDLEKSLLVSFSDLEPTSSGLEEEKSPGKKKFCLFVL